MLCNGNHNISSESGNSEHINRTTAGPTVFSSQTPNFFIISCTNYLYIYSFHRELSIIAPEGSLPNGTKLSIWAGYECIAEKYIDNDGDSCTINVNATGVIAVIATLNLRPCDQVLFQEGLIAPFIINSIADDGELLDTYIVRFDKGACMINVNEEGEIDMQEIEISDLDEEMDSSDSDTEEDDSSDTEEDTDNSSSDTDSDSDSGTNENYNSLYHNFQLDRTPSEEQPPPSTTNQLLKDCILTLSGDNSPLSSDSEGEGL